MQLQPQEYFTLFIQVSDHTDLSRDSYFCRAIVRNARTSDIIATVNLDSKGNGEYSKAWQVPADTSGLGFYIKVVTSVYTDSGYTTKSSKYGDEGNTYLVQDRMRNFGGGGVGVDYKRVREIIKEEIALIPVPNIEMPTIPSMDMSSTHEKMEDMHNELLTNIQKTVDFTPIITELSGIKELITQIPEPVEINLAPVLDKVNAIQETIDQFGGNSEEVKAEIEAVKLAILTASEQTDTELENISTTLEKQQKDAQEAKNEGDMKEIGSDYRGRPVKVNKRDIRLSY